MQHSGVTGWHFSPRNFCWPTGKRGARKKVKMERKEGNLKGKCKVENYELWKWAEDLCLFLCLLFLVFGFGFLLFCSCFVLFLCLSLLETTEICLGSTKMEFFYRGKSIFHAGKKSGKVTFPPLENIPLPPLVQHESLVKNNISMDTPQLDLQNNASILTNDPCLGNLSFLSMKMKIFCAKK